jgi:threonine dehydrogenase-like Zn-dependent dehydrogenase
VPDKAWLEDSGREHAVMHGVILPGQERVEIERFEVPEPGHGQVLVRMKSSGLCGSDLRAIYHEHKGSGAERYQNVIAGHEPAGQVEAVGPGVRVCGSFEMGELLEHLARKRLHPEATVTHSFPLSEAKRAYEAFDAGKTAKVVISWE